MRSAAASGDRREAANAASSGWSVKMAPDSRPYHLTACYEQPLIKRIETLVSRISYADSRKRRPQMPSDRVKKAAAAKVIKHRPILGR